MTIAHLVSMSGGKDSTATAIVALETMPRDCLYFAFADTGNEHPLTYQYIDYLESALGIRIARLRRDFTAEWQHRLEWLQSDAPRIGNARNPPRGEAEIARVLKVFERGPTGNPYLDLCIIKGRFPSRRAQFCTQFMKTEPLTDHALTLRDTHAALWSWQGVRRNESAARSRLSEFEALGAGMFINRPIARWNASDTFDAMRAYGIDPNPLYKLGMNRVGCMPCINASKAEIAEIAARFPEHIDRIEEWEAAVSAASWRQESSFFPSPDNSRDRVGRGIRQTVEWAMTARGGRQFDIFKALAPVGCSSSYGLCE